MTTTEDSETIVIRFTHHNKLILPATSVQRFIGALCCLNFKHMSFRCYSTERFVVNFMVLSVALIMYCR
jgi:hypothetical protein